MAANDHLERWREILQKLQGQRMRLAESWDACLAELRLSGRPPEQTLLDDQTAYCDQLRRLCDEVSLEIPNVDIAMPPGLDAISQVLELYAVRQQARLVLEQLLQLEHVADPHYEPLLAIQAQARDCLDESSQTSESGDRLKELASLAAGEHPFCDLLRWQKTGAAMQDHEWDRLHDRVADSFGRSLATAIGRGRIVFAQQFGELMPTPQVCENLDLTSDTVPAQDGPPAAREPHDLHETVDFIPEHPINTPRLADRDTTESSCVFDFASTGKRMTGVLDNALERMLATPTASPTGAPLLQDDLSNSRPSESSSPRDEVSPDSGVLQARSQWRELRGRRLDEYVPHQTPTAALAGAALATTGEERVRCLFRLIDQLLIDDQLDVAYQFMRVLEGQPTTRLTPLPASLIRACLLSRHVCYPQGELNRHVEDDLRKQQPKRYQEFPTEGRLAYEFLCRAAALLPALLCSSTSAVRLLQAFPIEPGLIQLYNYCSRIASYAERLQGRTGEMLQTGEIGPGGSQELSALRQAAHDWLTQGLKQTITYSRSSPLFLHAHWTVTAGTLQQSPEIIHVWSQWQETWLIIHRLLRPVIRGLGSDRTWVKHEIERLTPILRANPWKKDQPASNGLFDDQQAAMRDALSQAVEFATGWLRLKGGNSSSSSNLPVREMEELSVEIRERSAAVLSELRPFAGIPMSPTVRAGAFCLMRVIQRIHALFESQTALAWREPELRHLLHAVLLKIPCLPLNEQWEPQVDPDIVETELLEQISRGAGSWREAFDLQCRHGDHIATGRLLELPVWSSPNEHADLANLRQQSIEESRRDLQADIDNLASELEALSAADALAAADRPILRRRIERLQSSISKTLDFPIAEIQIQQLRLMLQRRSVSARVEIPDTRMENWPEPPVEAAPAIGTRYPNPESPPLTEPPAENAWVMDLLWEDR